MSRIDWATLIADGEGRIQLRRVATVVSIGLALLGGLLSLAAATYEVVSGHEIHTQALLIALGAHSAPLAFGMAKSGLTSLGKSGGPDGETG